MSFFFFDWSEAWNQFFIYMFVYVYLKIACDAAAAVPFSSSPTEYVKSQRPLLHHPSHLPPQRCTSEQDHIPQVVSVVQTTRSTLHSNKLPH
jgi:hypothetical protein